MKPSFSSSTPARTSFTAPQMDPNLTTAAQLSAMRAAAFGLVQPCSPQLSSSSSTSFQARSLSDIIAEALDMLDDDDFMDWARQESPQAKNGIQLNSLLPTYLSEWLSEKKHKQGVWAQAQAPSKTQFKQKPGQAKYLFTCLYSMAVVVSCLAPSTHPAQAWWDSFYKTFHIYFIAMQHYTHTYTHWMYDVLLRLLKSDTLLHASMFCYNTTSRRKSQMTSLFVLVCVCGRQAQWPTRYLFDMVQ